MKIFSITINKPQLMQRKNIENNQYDYSQNRLPVLTQLKTDTCSFTAKIPSITAPTMEDLINKTKAVDVLRFNILRLAEYDIPCPVCGQLMLSVNKYNAFEEKILSTTDTDKLLAYIGEYKKYLHPIEKKMFSIFKEKHAQEPEKSLIQILRDMLPVAEPKIVHEQMGVLSNIGLLSRELPQELQQKVSVILQDTFSRILDPRKTSRFSRRVFIDKLETQLINYAQIKEQFGTAELAKYINIEALPEAYSNSDIQGFIEARGGDFIFDRHALLQYTPKTVQNIIEEATKLPTAYNNLNAFVVKYAKRNYHDAIPDQKIALRMLSNSLATIEHIEATKLQGETKPANLALECACDNNRRGHSPILQQIIENPKMVINYPKYMKRLCEIHLMDKVEKSYISQQNNTFKRVSFGLLEADLNPIRVTKKHKTKEKINTTSTTKEKQTKRKATTKPPKNSHTNKKESKGYRR